MTRGGGYGFASERRLPNLTPNLTLIGCGFFVLGVLAAKFKSQKAWVKFTLLLQI